MLGAWKVGVLCPLSPAPGLAAPLRLGLAGFPSQSSRVWSQRRGRAWLLWPCVPRGYLTLSSGQRMLTEDCRVPCLGTAWVLEGSHAQAVPSACPCPRPAGSDPFRAAPAAAVTASRQARDMRLWGLWGRSSDRAAGLQGPGCEPGPRGGPCEHRPLPHGRVPWAQGRRPVLGGGLPDVGPQPAGPWPTRPPGPPTSLAPTSRSRPVSLGSDSAVGLVMEMTRAAWISAGSPLLPSGRHLLSSGLT